MIIDAFFKVAVPVLTVVVILGTIFRPKPPAAGQAAGPIRHKTAIAVILLVFAGIHAVMIAEVARHLRDPVTRVIISILLALPVYTVSAVVMGLYFFIADKFQKK